MPDTGKGRLDRLIDAGLDELMTSEPAMTSEAFDHGHDRLLAAMRADNVSTAGSHRGTGSGKEEIMTATQEAPAAVPAVPAVSRKRTRWLVAAAAAVVLTAGLLVAQTLDFGGFAGGTPQASAAPVLNWLERRGEIGKPSRVPGHEGSGPAPDASSVAGEWTAPCGAFGYWAEDSKPSCDQGSWANPTPEFLAGLPKDPIQLYKRLLADSGTEADAVIDVGNALSLGRIPAEYRALLYRAIAHAPNLHVTERVATLDGRTGTALGINAHGEVRDFVIDPDNGEFIGYREVLSAEEHGMEAGTIRAWSSTTTAVVDTAGEGPTR
jgi:hypothetical protein